jgi:hypothetical protein
MPPERFEDRGQQDIAPSVDAGGIGDQTRAIWSAADHLGRLLGEDQARDTAASLGLHLDTGISWALSSTESSWATTWGRRVTLPPVPSFSGGPVRVAVDIHPASAIAPGETVVAGEARRLSHGGAGRGRFGGGSAPPSDGRSGRVAAANISLPLTLPTGADTPLVPGSFRERGGRRLRFLSPSSPAAGVDWGRLPPVAQGYEATEEEDASEEEVWSVALTSPRQPRRQRAARGRRGGGAIPARRSAVSVFL